MKLNYLALALCLALPALAAHAADPAMAKDGMLVDGKGMTLYTFDKDSGGKSMCNDQCEKFWPPLKAAAGAMNSDDWSVVTRGDGSKQWAYYGKPLYNFANDQKPGDKNGEGMMGGAWHVAKPQ
ncbi:COG4315 family predicted lipoprotein [Pseudomonas panipatensis]|uniref:Predicted lipoprotein with conserved Yx(FWY)xxD motif n=1 Tax=Pseudomonas panipatensis TaxID=428992 RepID=A0A1G8JQU5_9PSED|nr:hypothetical protein [Pseudomonas panipatensis]SDI33624.1 Predicted lipoprotein with conserved Yx(FWY)xxD motif [Pseudomonas panipatensis]SMP62504.1 Predicted lipoprotein with conserved Yx(FWY)xxD motif [Pseudomonas panipatensis]